MTIFRSKTLLSICLLMLSTVPGINAQYSVKIIIERTPLSHAGEPIFITGNFNRWIVAEPRLKVQKGRSGAYEIELKGIAKGLLEFKFNRGSWQKLECASEGRLADPHNALIEKDTVLSVTIHGWRDDYPVSTASPQVSLLANDFFIPQLNTSRTIWIYLPKDYQNSSKRYPVLYMHDGQALFDEATSQGRTGPVEWGVDETIDRGEKSCIVVGINHNADKTKRIQEYYIYPNEQYDTVYGREYMEFIVEDLKPFIDKHYRTLPDKKNTSMCGSSMGGLLTLYAGLLYPEVFGSLGVLSPSVWLDYGNSYREIEKLPSTESYNSQRYYFYAGGNENRAKPDGGYVQMHTDVQQTVRAMQKRIRPQIDIAINPSGRHGPWYWSLAFPAFYQWLMSDH